MAASANSATTPAEKRVAEQGIEQKFLAETQKESIEMDRMVAQQQMLNEELDGSSVGSLGSFSVVDFTSVDDEELILEQIEGTHLHVGNGLRKCCCGMDAKFYVNRKMGVNFGRRCLRCPKATEMQCGFFLWIEATKYQATTGGTQQKGYQKEVENPGILKDPAARGSQESSKHFPLVSNQALMEISIPKYLPTMVQQCIHFWDRTGTNGNEERMTCNRCGLRFRRNRKTNATSWELAPLEKEPLKASIFKAREALAESMEATPKR